MYITTPPPMSPQITTHIFIDHQYLDCISFRRSIFEFGALCQQCPFCPIFVFLITMPHAAWCWQYLHIFFRSQADCLWPVSQMDPQLNSFHMNSTLYQLEWCQLMLFWTVVEMSMVSNTWWLNQLHQYIYFMTLNIWHL